MSLTSRLSNLFSQDSSAGDPQESQRNGYAGPDFDLDGARQIKRQRTMEKLGEEEIDHELKRPPYLHVRKWLSCQMCSVLLTMRSRCSLEALVERPATF
jgi:hypothetical protein